MTSERQLVNSGRRPVLRWAGGKTAIISPLSSLLPAKWNTYIEPMVGGGALFFHLRPENAILADINSELINFYRVLKSRCDELKAQLLSLSASRERYYGWRDTVPRGDLQRAVRFAYLNRLSWNGLYRVNRSGRFNVPIGDRLPQIMWRAEDLDRGSESLQHARLLTADFGKTIRLAEKGDFVFLDPPYPRGAKGDLGFNRYSADFFQLHHHRRLSRSIDALSDRGAKVMITVAGDDQLEGVYPEYLHRHEYNSKSLISCNGGDRGEVRELVLTNYATQEVAVRASGESYQHSSDRGGV
jgi:DNA adenine methylase